MVQGDNDNNCKLIFENLFRYKCVECGDYDVCGSCHDQGRHSEHSMIKIVSPFVVCSNGCGVDPIIGDRLNNDIIHKM